MPEPKCSFFVPNRRKETVCWITFTADKPIFFPSTDYPKHSLRTPDSVEFRQSPRFCMASCWIEWVCPLRAVGWISRGECTSSSQRMKLWRPSTVRTTRPPSSWRNWKAAVWSNGNAGDSEDPAWFVWKILSLNRQNAIMHNSYTARVQHNLNAK